MPIKDIPGQTTLGGDDIPPKPKQKRRVYNLKKVVTEKGPEYVAFPKDEFREIEE